MSYNYSLPSIVGFLEQEVSAIHRELDAFNNLLLSLDGDFEDDAVDNGADANKNTYLNGLRLAVSDLAGQRDRLSIYVKRLSDLLSADEKPNITTSAPSSKTVVVPYHVVGQKLASAKPKK